MIVGTMIIKEDHVPKMMVDHIFNLRDSYFLDNLNIYFFSLSFSFLLFFFPQEEFRQCRLSHGHGMVFISKADMQLQSVLGFWLTSQFLGIREW